MFPNFNLYFFKYSVIIIFLQIIRNAQIGNVWGHEEREGKFPFKKDIGTDIVFHNAPYSLQVNYT